MAEVCKISFGPCQERVTKKLEMNHIAVQFVPMVMTEDQKQHRVEVCEDLVERTNNNRFLKNIITGDKTWV